MFYRLELTPDDNGTYLVTAPDLPEVTSFGETEADSIEAGRNAVDEAVAARLATMQPIPASSAGDGPRVPVDATLAIKALLLNALLDEQMNRAELARRMQVHRPQVDRLFDPRHASRLDQLAAAFEAVGRPLTFATSSGGGPVVVSAAPRAA